MAFLYRRGAAGAQFEIRESESTERGPRSRTLLAFRGVLTHEQMLEAGRRARGRFDARALVARARELGIPVRPPANREVRGLLAELRAGQASDPILLGLLRQYLDAAAVAEAPPELAELAEVAEWVGASAEERGAALRGLLRVTDRIVATRDATRFRRRTRFPRFRSRRRRVAA